MRGVEWTCRAKQCLTASIREVQVERDDKAAGADDGRTLFPPCPP
jgi:hypothetical protein